MFVLALKLSEWALPGLDLDCNGKREPEFGFCSSVAAVFAF